MTTSHDATDLARKILAGGDEAAETLGRDLAEAVIASGWIPCSERKPGRDVACVLAWSLADGEIVIARYDRDSKDETPPGWYKDGPWGKSIQVSHWMPLPKDPQ
jgi:hypothetical protein